MSRLGTMLLVLVLVSLFFLHLFGQKGKPITVVMIPKIKGIDYFNACERGAKEAAKELGNVQLIYEGPTEASVERQVEMIEAWLIRKPDVIAVACNDPTAIAPALKKALQAGIKVITYDADARRDARLFFVNQATYEDIAHALVDTMAKEAGPDAPVAVVTSSFTAPNQTEWLKRMKSYMAKKYPKMRLLTVKPSEESMELALRVTTDILRAYRDVQGVFGISSVAFPGAAEAVLQAGKAGKVAVVGLSTPKTMKPYVHKGVVKTVILWNPVDLGYLTIYAARALCDGTLKKGVRHLQAGRLGKKVVRDDEVLLGPPMFFTKKNIDRYDF
ncbi:MAG: substrate-binding domain-containing protein [Armatimonadetes bacterium]|nr:substrate-binding domain-containing protein [Armatimonadota bacterium]MDW8123057.1 substrate-binding domain-containing protein [Armatimonadota bacterium]